MDGPESDTRQETTTNTRNTNLEDIAGPAVVDNRGLVGIETNYFTTDHGAVSGAADIVGRGLNAMVDTIAQVTRAETDNVARITTGIGAVAESGQRTARDSVLESAGITLQAIDALESVSRASMETTRLQAEAQNKTQGDFVARVTQADGGTTAEIVKWGSIAAMGIAAASILSKRAA